ncbi:MAG: AMP-binding protein, partial [Thalassobaculaceae bacterium]
MTLPAALFGGWAMYRLRLSESFVPAQSDVAVLETTVGGLLRQRAAERPAARALIEIGLDGATGRQWTYGELLADATRLANALASRYTPGERVVVWAPNIPEWVLMEYATALAGLVLVTANPAYQTSELRYVLEQSGAAGLFMVPSHRGNPMAEIAAAALDGLPAVRECVDLRDPAALFRRAGPAGDLPVVRPEDAAQIQYTSGTTGFPKGAVLSHRGLTNNARLSAIRSNAHGDTLWANFMSLFHTAGCAIITLGALHAGCAMAVVPLFDPAIVNRLVAREKVTAFVAVPTMLVALLENLAVERHDMSSMEMVISGGSMVAPELAREVLTRFNCGLQTVYGQTECCPIITQHQSEDSLDDICNTVGQPLPQTAVSVRDPASDAIVPVDTVGEICVRGYCNMIGYHANPAATAETVDAEGWLHTGDLGALDARGYLRITGRVKEMIIRGGENLFPAEIENTLLEHGDVAEVAVIG